LNLEKGEDPVDSTVEDDDLEDDEKDEEDLLDFCMDNEAESPVADVLTLCSNCLPRDEELDRGTDRHKQPKAGVIV